MPLQRVLVVDDDPAIRRMLVSRLQRQNIPTLGIATMQQTLEELRREPADLLIVDLQLPDGNGLEVLQGVKQLGLTLDIIMMTGFGSIETAIEAMKLGASNYLLKPFSLGQFELAINAVLEQRNLRDENRTLKERLAEESSDNPLLYQSPEMSRVMSLVKRVAPTDATVLIQGESGTGKELIARAIHENSNRAGKPYIKLNCAAVPDNLLESEFFGHERGAFTGATSRREGRFEQANGGTLLLDEISEIPSNLQSKLLRVLQEQEFERVGGNRTLHVDVRIIASTNRDLLKSVEAGNFRQDLYFRLNVVPLQIPPLRERKAEIEFLVQEFLKIFAQKHGKAAPHISSWALEQLASYSWPGNVRELRNYTERALILWEGTKDLEALDFSLPLSPVDDGLFPTGGNTFPTIADIEKRLINLALKKTGGQRTEAARILGINVRTLRNKLHEYQEGEFAENESESKPDRKPVPSHDIKAA